MANQAPGAAAVNYRRVEYAQLSAALGIFFLGDWCTCSIVQVRTFTSFPNGGGSPTARPPFSLSSFSKRSRERKLCPQ